MSIYEATKANCVEHQHFAHAAAASATLYLQHGMLEYAGWAQRSAQFHHDEAWMRLARLIGVE